MLGFGDLFNRLSDMDWGWWPFLGLRPSKDTEMTARTVARIAVALGGFYAPLLFLVLALAGKPPTLAWALGAMVISVLVFFAVYRLTFAAAWNERARWLRARRHR